MKFIAELGDVSPLSWLLLACLVAVNFFRAAVIDPSPTKKTCRNIPMQYYEHSRDYLQWTTDNKAIVQPGEGTDVEGSTPPCDAYVLLYAYFCIGSWVDGLLFSYFSVTCLST